MMFSFIGIAQIDTLGKIGGTSANYPCNDPDTCQLVLNGNLQQHGYQQDESCHWNYDPKCEVCNWTDYNSSPRFCVRELDASTSLLMGDWGEAVVTEQDVPLQDGEQYLLIFEYYITYEGPNFDPGALENTKLTVGLTDNAGTERILDELDDNILQINEIGGYFRCYNENTPFNQYPIVFTYNAGDPKQLFFKYKDTPSSDPRSFAYVRDIAVPVCGDTCLPEPRFTDTLSNCEVCFYGSNNGDQGTYCWDFGDGNTATGQNVCHEYIRGGSYRVCLEIKCNGSDSGVSFCKIVKFHNPAQIVIHLSIEPVLANRCDTSDYLSSYKANFRFKLPQTGLDLCPGSSLKFLSDDAEITTISYEIQRGALDMCDYLKAEIEIDPYDAILPDCSSGESIIASFVLCDTDTLQYCYSFPICAQNSCEECLGTLSVTADCDESASFAGNYVYTGSLTFNTVSDFTPGIPSSQACGVLNFPYQGSLTSLGGNDFIFEYTIFTRDPNFSGTSATLCVVNGDNGKNACIEVDITIGEQCDEQNPEECDEWLPKTLECTSVDGSGNIVFNMDTDVTLAGNYQICPGGVSYNITSPASLVVNSFSITGNILSYDIDIVVPPTYNPNQIYTFEIILCNAEGEVVCLRMYFWLEECDPASLPRSANTGSGVFQATNDDIMLIPNPANSFLKIASKRIQRNQKYHYSIVAMNGAQSHFEIEGSQGYLRIDLEQFGQGIYIVKIWNEKEIIGTEKLIIAR